MKNIFSFLLLIIVSNIYATPKRILFIGNSYTYVNNLPQLLADLALSAGDTIVYDSNTPGGFTFENHCTNATTLSKIALGNWDYVILQEQSQRPSFSPLQVSQEVLPFAKRLDSLVHVSNACAQTLFYMTWGRINGDASNCQFYPPVCTYSGMQQRLRQSYLLMSNNNNAITAPVGVAWQNVRNQFPTINLYSSDGSHPSLEGSYLAACVFYSSIYKTQSLGLNFISTLNPTLANQLQQVASSTVLDSLDVWNTNIYYPKAEFSFDFDLVNNNTIHFQNLSTNAQTYEWNFGDNSPINNFFNPSHSYTQTGIYNVSLKAINSCFQDLYSLQINLSILSNPLLTSAKHNFINPLYSNDFIKVELDSDSYFSIINLVGKVVIDGRLNQSSNTINIAHLTSGFFILNINKQNFKFYKF